MHLFGNRRSWCFGQAGPAAFSRADPWARSSRRRGAIRSATPSPSACTRLKGPTSWGRSDCRSESACLLIIDYELWKNGHQSYPRRMLLRPACSPKLKNGTLLLKHIDNDEIDKLSVILFKFLPFFYWVTRINIQKWCNMHQITFSGSYWRAESEVLTGLKAFCFAARRLRCKPTHIAKIKKCRSAVLNTSFLPS